jgi:hypothetical protein
MDQIRVTSIGHDRTEAWSKHAELAQRITRIEGGKVVGEVKILFKNGNAIDSQIMLEAGQLLVLGQTGFDAKRLAPFGEGEDLEDITLYYVVASSLGR